MRSAILTIALVLLAASPAAAQQDLRSPDARDAARADLARQDLRLPDTVDAAAGRGTSTAPNVAVVKLTKPAPERGTDWSDAGMGAAFTLVLAAGFGTAVVVRRRRPGRTHLQTAISG